MATVHGNALGIYVSDTAGHVTGTLDPDNAQLIACSTNATLSLSNATIETACKKDTSGVLDDASVRHTIPGQQTFSISVEGLVDLTAPDTGTENFNSLMDIAMNRDDILVVFSNRVASEQEYFGLGFISSIEVSASVDDFATFSATIEGNGDLQAAAHT